MQEVPVVFYFRERELKKLDNFMLSGSDKAMAIFGRRRTGKTQLIMEYLGNCRKSGNPRNVIYFQASGYDYSVCLNDFKATLVRAFPELKVTEYFKTFKDVISYISERETPIEAIIIDEFPFIAKKNENVPVEFQWIIDHGLGRIKLILLGSNRSFMKKQINDSESPLYGRFDEIMEVRPFSYRDVRTLFPNFEDAVRVYAATGGVAQYVMLYTGYSSVDGAETDLFFTRDGRLLQEAHNILLQELKDVTTYTSILRAIGGGKTAGQIAGKCEIDQRAIYAYLTRLEEIGVVSVMYNPFPGKNKEKRYVISDHLFRFNYTFIEPNISLINALDAESKGYILGNRYSEYLGLVYEEIIRDSCYEYSLKGLIPFMPNAAGKWWGNICEEGVWSESEVDFVAFNDSDVLIGECKYREKAAGPGELDRLILKSQFIPVKGRKKHYVLASKSGFTEELKQRRDVILIERDGFDCQVDSNCLI